MVSLVPHELRNVLQILKLKEGEGLVSKKTILQAAMASGASGSRAKKKAADIQKILVVDDNKSIADLLSKILKNAGYEVKTVYDGQAAIKKFKDFNPSVCIIDIGLPKINGYKVATAIRKLEKLNVKKTKLIAITGYGQYHDKEMAIKSGFDRHITKPVEVDFLISVISEKKATKR